jgi:hypothetical protein
MTNEYLSLDELKRIIGEDYIPSDVDTTIFMKHFNVAIHRVIGEKTIDKIKRTVDRAIEATRLEQSKNLGRVLESPLQRGNAIAKKDIEKPKLKKIEQKSPEKKQVQKEDKYGLSSIKKGFVSKRLEERSGRKVTEISEPIKIEEPKEAPSKREIQVEVNESFDLPSLETDIESEILLPSIESLKSLSGESLKREEMDEAFVSREVAIREYQHKTEMRSARWGKTKVKDFSGKEQEINNPSYIFHSDIWQLEKARESIPEKQCGIMKHVFLDMVANSINVAMLPNEDEPFFVVEGYGLLQSKETLKDNIAINKLIQLLVISCEAWEIALKRPESMIKGRGAYGGNELHSIDMTSVIPLEKIRQKFIEIDNDFQANYEHPKTIIQNALSALQKHRKNIIYACGNASLEYLKDAIKQHKKMIRNPTNQLNILVIGTKRAYHPIKISYEKDNFHIEELLPDYCSRHQMLSEEAIITILGSLPIIYGSEGTKQSHSANITKIISSVNKRIAFSASELVFDPGYIKGQKQEIFPLSKMDIIIPPNTDEIKQKLKRKKLIED